MGDWMLAVVIGAGVGLLLGVKIARDSHADHPVMGGPLAQVFHYLACVGLTGMLPFIITGIIVGLHFLELFGTALSFLAFTALMLLIYAAIEQNAPEARRSHLIEDIGR